MFRGGNPDNYQELKGKFSKWSLIFRLYSIGRNSRYGYLVSLPCSGGLLNQPAVTMECMEILMSAYMAEVSNSLKSSMR